MRRAIALLAQLSVLALPGCYESHTRLPLSDGGVPPRPDGAVRDALVEDNDAGLADAGVERVDTGVAICTGEVVPPPIVRCAGGTAECLAGCADAACAEACVTSDPGCVQCFDEALISCSNERVCQAPWDAFACCTERACPELGAGAARLECVTRGACLEEFEVYSECVGSGAVEACEPFLARCLEP